MDFGRLYESQSREIWGILYSRVHNSDTASELMQEVFLKLWKRMRVKNDIHSPVHWLKRAAVNLARDHLKSARQTKHSEANLSELASGHTPKPIHPILDQELRDIIRKEIQVLPPIDREMLTMHYLLDYRAAEIAAQLSLSEAAVHMRLSRARVRIRERLRERGIEANEFAFASSP